MTQVFLGKYEGKQVVALAHDDHYHIAYNHDGDSRDQIVEWLNANLTQDNVQAFHRRWPKRSQDEVTDLDLIYDDGI